MRLPTSLLLTCSCIVLSSCSLFMSKQDLYLRSAQDHATQREVQEHLGQPKVTLSKATGELLWVYQVREEQPGNRVTAPGTWCDEYVLMFDQQEILRRWTHRSYFHGGELMPTYCVPGGYSSQS